MVFWLEIKFEFSIQPTKSTITKWYFLQHYLVEGTTKVEVGSIAVSLWCHSYWICWANRLCPSTEEGLFDYIQPGMIGYQENTSGKKGAWHILPNQDVFRTATIEVNQTLRLKCNYAEVVLDVMDHCLALWPPLSLLHLHFFSWLLTIFKSFFSQSLWTVTHPLFNTSLTQPGLSLTNTTPFVSPHRPVILFLPWLDQIAGVKKETFALENVGGKGGMKKPIFLNPVQFPLFISNWFNSLCPLYVCFRRQVQQCVAQCHAWGEKYDFPCVFSLKQLSCV